MASLMATHGSLWASELVTTTDLRQRSSYSSMQRAVLVSHHGSEAIMAQKILAWLNIWNDIVDLTADLIFGAGTQISPVPYRKCI
jgi:hypothetical protein